MPSEPRSRGSSAASEGVGEEKAQMQRININK
jgi:hypothetical protein